jgi:soluble lytic murein transglycosylase-like protein
MPGVLNARVATLLDEAAERYGMPRALARAVAWIESKGDQSRVSPAGAVGVMQLMPDTAEGLNVDRFDFEENIDGGVRYLARLVQQYGERAGVASYNSGPGRGALPETTWSENLRGYVANVLARRDVEASGLPLRAKDYPPGQHRGGGVAFVVVALAAAIAITFRYRGGFKR